jgi:hypothetical protein
MSCLAFYRKLQLQEVYELDGETRDIEPLGATVHKPSLSLSLAYFRLKDLHLLSSLTIKKQLQKPLCSGLALPKKKDREGHAKDGEKVLRINENTPNIITTTKR